ncbi:MAG: hypothetical protein ACKOPM_13465 [Novosphingobium sp.]
MVRGIWAALLAVLLLGGCGRGSEDFTVQVERPADRVMDALGHLQLEPTIASRFGGLKVDRTSPAPHEVLYTILGDGSFPTTIHLTFEAVDGGKSTVVHAAIDVPAVKVNFDGKTKVISEFKVERTLRDIITVAGKSLESGGDVEPQTKEFSEVMTALAIVTDSKQLALAKDMERNPDWYMGGLDSLYDGDSGSGDEPDPAYGRPAEGTDPNAAAREQEWKEKQRTADAAAPADDTAGDDTSGT